MILYPTPYFRTPLSEIFPVMVNLQRHEQCAQRELDVVDCMDAYGLHRGQEKCRLLVEDMYECVFRAKRDVRRAHMRWEYKRKMRLGEKDPNPHPEPPLDLF